jgi:hypothetical protein
MRALAAVCLVCLALPAAASALRVPGRPPLALPARMQIDAVGDALQLQGMATHIWAFRCDAPAAALAQHFAAQWPGQMRRHRTADWDVLSHRDGDWLVTVQMREPAGLGGVQGFIAMAPVFESAAPTSARDLPLMPDTHLVQDIVAEDLGRRSRTRVLLSTRSAAQHLDFYRAHFRREGYRPLADKALTRSARGGAMVLGRGGEQLDVAVAQDGAQTVIAIVQVLP